MTRVEVAGCTRCIGGSATEDPGDPAGVATGDPYEPGVAPSPPVILVSTGASDAEDPASPGACMQGDSDAEPEGDAAPHVDDVAAQGWLPGARDRGVEHEEDTAPLAVPLAGDVATPG